MKKLINDVIQEVEDDTMKILDLSMGWGGRLIGALSGYDFEEKNIKYVGLKDGGV